MTPHHGRLLPATAITILALGVMPLAAASAAPSPAAAGSSAPFGSGVAVATVRDIEVPGARLVSMSPDGRWIVAARPTPGPYHELCVFDVATLAERACGGLSPLAAAIRLDDVAWSRDGSKLAFSEEIATSFTDGDLWLMDTASGALTNLDDDAFAGRIPPFGDAPPGVTITLPVAPAFSSDGQRVAFSRSLIVDGKPAGDDISVFSVDGGPPERLVGVAEGRDILVAFGDIEWSPDDRAVYHSVRDAGAGVSDGIWMVDTATGASRVVATTMASDGGPLTLVAVSPRGDRLLAYDPVRAVRFLEGPVLALVDPTTGGTEPHEAPVSREGTPGMVMPATFSPDGSMLLLVTRMVTPDFQVHVRDLASGEVTAVLPNGLPLVPAVDVPTWSTSGTVFIRAGAGDREGSGDVAALSRAALLEVQSG